MSEFKVGDKVLIDCNREPELAPNTLQGQIVLICNWPSGADDKYGCAYERELPSMKVSVWCRAEQLQLQTVIASPKEELL